MPPVPLPAIIGDGRVLLELQPAKRHSARAHKQALLLWLPRRSLAPLRGYQGRTPARWQRGARLCRSSTAKQVCAKDTPNTALRLCDARAKIVRACGTCERAALRPASCRRTPCRFVSIAHETALALCSAATRSNYLEAVLLPTRPARRADVQHAAGGLLNPQVSPRHTTPNPSGIQFMLQSAGMRAL